MKTKLKTWSKPEIVSIDLIKNAANGSHDGLQKGPLAIEYEYNGPGS